MYIEQLQDLCHRLRLRPEIRPHDRGVVGIGGGTKGTGTETIPIMFPDLRLIIDVNLLLMSGKMPSLLCMKDMKKNDLDITLQDQKKCGTKKHNRKAWKISS